MTRDPSTEPSTDPVRDPAGDPATRPATPAADTSTHPERPPAEAMADAAPEASHRTPAHPRSGTETAIIFALASAVLSFAGLLLATNDTVGWITASLIVLGLALLSGIIGIVLGFTRGRSNPAYIAIGTSIFAVLAIIFAIMRFTGADVRPADLGAEVEGPPGAVGDEDIAAPPEEAELD